MCPRPDPNLETQTLASTSAARPGVRPHLLVIQGASSSRVWLPSGGALLVGRAAEADLRIDSGAISRRHARFVVADGEVSVADLDSHNGVRVNGERIAGARTLSPGDVIALGDVALILRCEPPARSRSALDAGQLRQRLEEEVERAADYGRPLAVLALLLNDGAAPRAAGQEAAAAVRRMDIVAWGGAAQLVVVFPELAGEAARSAAAELVEALAPVAPGARGGFACLPADGCDADTLLSAARAAAEVAAPGGVAAAAEATVRHVLGDEAVILADPAMIRLFDLIRRLSQSDLPVLVLGETGAGKENAAAAVHRWSRRAAGPFVAVNCATLPETLVESELFGYERGAFSGAAAAKPGLLERASGGTIFLDEVGELPLGAQAKLLRALEVKRIQRLGDVREREVDVRVVAATNRDLEAECKAGRFRQDLLFRLGAAAVDLPPLRQRPREIPILARAFLARARARLGLPEVELSDAALRALAAHPWPGNVRELKNAMEFAAATLQGGAVEVWDLPPRVAGRAAEEPAAPGAHGEAPATGGAAPGTHGAAPATGGAAPGAHGAAPGAHGAAPGAPRRFTPIAEEVRQLERRRMEEALEATGGVQTRAAELIGMPVRTFVLKVKQYGLSQRETKRRP
ncbi:sigma 54-interacting transcriptional regulator [Sorangium sp. So ce513]|uniref:sigma 54-interacting transcriptional regulator n=1 Tax=Sorangium sp. So ce513 TaxID=3133315 RepID=UPI003F640821